MGIFTSSVGIFLNIIFFNYIFSFFPIFSLSWFLIFHSGIQVSHGFSNIVRFGDGADDGDAIGAGVFVVGGVYMRPEGEARRDRLACTGWYPLALHRGAFALCYAGVCGFCSRLYLPLLLFSKCDDCFLVSPLCR